MQAQEVGRAGLGARAGDDGDDLAGLDVAVLFEQALGALDQRLGGVDLGAEDRGGAPQQAEAIDGDFDRAEREDGRRGVILRELAGGLSRLGEERNAAQVQVVGGVRRGLADGLGDRQMDVLRCLPAFVLLSSLMLRSASTTMRAIMETASTGYLPTADSPESITASVPS